MSTKLNVTTPSDLEIVLTRSFNAPGTLVWEAMSQPDLIAEWLQGPPGWTMDSCEDDLRVGGEFCWGWSGPDGASIAMRGVYREVTPPRKVVRTERFEIGGVAQGDEQLGTLELTEEGNQTTLTLTVLYFSKEARDAALASGMERGIGAGYDRLEEILSARV